MNGAGLRSAGGFITLDMPAILRHFDAEQELALRKQAALCRLSVRGFMHVTIKSKLRRGRPLEEDGRELPKETFTVTLDAEEAAHLRAAAEYAGRSPESALALLAKMLPDVEAMREDVEPLPPDPDEEEEQPLCPLVPLKDARGSLAWFLETLEARGAHDDPPPAEKRQRARLLALEAGRLLEEAEAGLTAALNPDGREAA